MVKTLSPVMLGPSTTKAFTFAPLTDEEGRRWVVDRTPYLLEASKLEQGQVHVFTRPRQFGKTTFLQMLCEYWDCSISDDAYAASMPGFWITRNRASWALQGAFMTWTAELCSRSVQEIVDRANEEFAKKYDLSFTKLGNWDHDFRKLCSTARKKLPDKKVRKHARDEQLSRQSPTRSRPDCGAYR